MIEVDQLEMTFGGRATASVRAVDGLSFRVEAGEVYGLLGPNGAGKTTTLRILATLLRPSAGRVRLDGIDVVKQPLKARTKLAYVPAEAGLPERLTPREVVLLFAHIQGVADPRRATDHWLEALGANTFADEPCGTLSTGMKRRVVLARALLHNPRILLLDEPTDGLDVSGRRDVLTLIREQTLEDRAIVLSSHIMSEVERVVHRIGVVADGRLADEGTIAEVQSRTGTTNLDDAFLALTEAS